MQKVKERQGHTVRVKVIEGKSERIAVRVRRSFAPQVRTASFGLVFLG